MGFNLFSRQTKKGRVQVSAQGAPRKAECPNFGHYTFVHSGKYLSP